MKKIILVFLALLLLLAAFSTYQYFKFNDGTLDLVSCNVGQGDGIFIRSPKGLDILIDSGPDDSILNCLSDHMPFWNRSIELAFLTHPHQDHMRGFISVSRRYKVKNFATEKLENDTVLYKELIKLIEGKVPAGGPASNSLGEAGEVHQRRQNLYAGDRFRLSDGLEFKILGPSKEFLEKTSPIGVISESEGFGNLITLVSYGSFRALLTGDSQTEGLNEAIEQLQDKQQIGVFQIPHHGSRFGVDMDIVQKLNPKLAVISVGKNKYGHPSKEVIEILRNLDIKFLRTDQHGNIEIVVDRTGKFTVH